MTTTGGHFVWTGSPVALELGGFALHWYGLLNIVSFLVALWLFARDVRRSSADVDTLRIFRRVFWGAYVGSRLWYCAFDAPSLLAADPWWVLKVWEGGRSSFGGVLGATSMLLTGKAERERLLWLADRIAAPVGIGFAIVRAANFVNSEMIGGPAAQVPWGVVFPRLDLVPRHPVPLYEAVVFVAAAAMANLAARRWPGLEGRRLGVFLVVAYGGRLALEPMKVTTSEIPLDPWMCAAALVAGIVLAATAKRKEPHGHPVQA
jgi:prolipoprotein diacylglyceryl transferase